ncbi:MAG: LEPR-XLL domain-containing protein, partial [Opitutales bacterium]
MASSKPNFAVEHLEERVLLSASAMDASLFDNGPEEPSSDLFLTSETVNFDAANEIAGAGPGEEESPLVAEIDGETMEFAASDAPLETSAADENTGIGDQASADETVTDTADGTNNSDVPDASGPATTASTDTDSEGDVGLANSDPSGASESTELTPDSSASSLDEFNLSAPLTDIGLVIGADGARFYGPGSASDAGGFSITPTELRRADGTVQLISGTGELSQDALKHSLDRGTLREDFYVLDTGYRQ